MLSHAILHHGPLTLRACPPAFALQPAVSFANVGELALDVLITSLLPAGLRLVARVDEPNCLPVVGNDAYSLDQPGSLTTAMELFYLQGGVRAAVVVPACQARTHVHNN